MYKTAVAQFLRKFLTPQFSDSFLLPVGGAMVECPKKIPSDSYETLGSDSDWSHKDVYQVLA